MAEAMIIMLNEAIRLDLSQHLGKWSEYLMDHESIVAITTMPFTALNYGAVYELSNEQFNLTRLATAPIYSFTEFTPRKSKQNLLSSSLDLSEWEMGVGTTFSEVKVPEALDGISDVAYKVDYPSKSAAVKYNGERKIVWRYPFSVKSGQRVGTTMYLWSDSDVDLGGNLILQISRSGTGKQEFVNRPIEKISSNILKVEVKRTFAEAHSGVRVALIYVGDEPISVQIALTKFRFLQKATK